jgi:hypothetical protein
MGLFMVERAVIAQTLSRFEASRGQARCNWVGRASEPVDGHWRAAAVLCCGVPDCSADARGVARLHWGEPGARHRHRPALNMVSRLQQTSASMRSRGIL